jgi:hypothetical protein
VRAFFLASVGGGGPVNLVLLGRTRDSRVFSIHQLEITLANQNRRYEIGSAALAIITGGTGTAVVESRKVIAPDLAEWVVSRTAT